MKLTLISDSIGHWDYWPQYFFPRIDVVRGEDTYLPWSGGKAPGTAVNEVYTGIGHTFFDGAVSGETSEDMDTRFAMDALGHDTDEVWIAAGANDVMASWPASRTFVAVDSMIAKARAAGKPVRLIGVTPNDTANETQKDVIDELNAGYAARVAEDVTYTDMYAATADLPTRTWKSGYSDLGVHPLPAGSRAMGEAVDITGYEVYRVSPQSFRGIDGLVADWRVTAAGQLYDPLSQGFNTWNTGSTLGGVVPWSTLVADGRGQAGVASAGAKPDVPTTMFDATQGTFLFVGQNPADAVNSYPFYWSFDGNNLIEIRFTNNTPPNMVAYVKATTLYQSGSQATVAGSCNVYGMTWVNGGPVIGYLNGVASTPSANCVTPTNLPVTMRVGGQFTTGYMANPWTRLLVFNRALTPAEMASAPLTSEILLGPARVTKRIALGGMLT